MKKFDPVVIVFIFSLFFAPSAMATTIDFNTFSPVEAKYSLDIVGDTEIDSLYGLAVGGIIDLSGLGPLFTGTYYVSSVEHSFNSGSYSSSFTLDRQEGLLVDDNGNTDINFIFLNYAVSTFDIQNENYKITNFTFTPVPEPLSWLLFAIGLVMLLLRRQRSPKQPF